MSNYSKFGEISPTAYADALGREQFMDMGIREMWPRIPRLAGPAYPVSCAPGDNLMLHAAIYRAPAGSVIVVQAGDVDYAVSGGNVCAIAQKRGIAGFIVDGVIRDVAEVREYQFPVFARGAMPIPGKKQGPGTLNKPIICGGVWVYPGDVAIADEEGIAIVPIAQQAEVWEIAKHRADRDTAQSLEDWETSHRAKIDRILADIGFDSET
ncbi:MAG: RraA family protein [Cyanobacteria bacterium P01_A01_bin.114]